jgi:hypothetical protein
VIKDPSVKIVELEPRMINVVQVEELCHHYEPNNST